MNSFLLLLGAHILADFYFQPTKWVVEKRKNIQKSKYLYYHVLVVLICSYVLLGNWANPLPAIIIALIHGLIDILKLKYDKTGSTKWFVADQALHVLTIAIVAVFLGSNSYVLFEQLTEWYHTPKIVATIAGLLTSLTPISFLVGMLTKPWRDELESLVPNANDNLANAGRWIGMSERILIFIFVMIGEYSSIGFLIAAKSLLRYNDKATGTEIPPAYISKKSEYVLVGTLMSYTCVILLALLVKLV